MDVKTTVHIAREYEATFKADDFTFETRVAFCVSIDPIDKKKRVTIYTDDGMGNGNEILTFDIV